MRRISVAVVIALSAALMLAPGVGAASLGDRASGQGTRAPLCAEGCTAGTFSFDARSGPHGGHPSGWFVIDFPGYAQFTGAVTCLHVHYHWATIYGQISTGTGAGDPIAAGAPMYFVAVVHDRSVQRSASPSKDKMSTVGWDTEAGWLADPGIALSDICANPFVAVGNDTMYSLVAGDMRVVDR